MSLDDEVKRIKFSKSALKKSSWTLRQSVSHGVAEEGFYRGHPSGPTRTKTGRPRKRPYVLPTRGEGWPLEEKPKKGKKVKAIKVKKDTVKQPHSLKQRARANWGKGRDPKSSRVRRQGQKRGG